MNMQSLNLLEKLEFHDQRPYAQPLFVDQHGRVLRFTLKPGQSISEHNVPDSPFYVVVLKGHGLFAGGDGQEQQVGPNTLLIFDPNENHLVQAGDEELVFVGFLQGVPGTRADRTGGELGRDST
jgi:quercetin dioxygenase-like cupin family protein